MMRANSWYTWYLKEKSDRYNELLQKLWRTSERVLLIALTNSLVRRDDEEISQFDLESRLSIFHTVI